MNINIIRRKSARGFTLLEALIAMVILATGLLAVARFQTNLIQASASAKAQAEAAAFAQLRLDEIRAYADEADLAGMLRGADLHPNATLRFRGRAISADGVTISAAVGEADRNILPGVNAEFNRSWDVSKNTDDLTAMVDVTVDWQGPLGAESLMLSGEVFYQDQDIIAGQATAVPISPPPIPGTSGRARLGDGRYDDPTSLGGRDNDDGTITYQVPNSNEVQLIDKITGDVLLTLEGACRVFDTDRACTDFVRIEGYVWIDQDHGVGIHNAIAIDLTPQDIFVLASDNAYCSMKNDLSGANAPTTVTTTVDGNAHRFIYFPYRCYVGGGWSGNIGMLFTSANAPVGACLGDPSSPVNVSQRQQAIDNNGRVTGHGARATRRLYRGMLARDSNPNDLEVDDANNDNIGDYDAIGAADGVVIPSRHNDLINADYLNGCNGGACYDGWGRRYLPGHNFLITDFGTRSDLRTCQGIMNIVPRDAVQLFDASGNAVKGTRAFAHNPDDFACLNQAYDIGAGNVGDALDLYFDGADPRIDDSADRRTSIFGFLRRSRDFALNNDQTRYTVAATAGGGIEYEISQVQNADISGNPGANILNHNDFAEHVLVQNECPYNPSRRVTSRNTISGAIHWVANSNNFTPGAPETGMVINTSDDIRPGLAGACAVTTRATVGPNGEMADYTCNVYHAHDETDRGWEGLVSICPKSGYSCSPRGETGAWHEFANVTADISGRGFDCRSNSGEPTSMEIDLTKFSGGSETDAGTLTVVEGRDNLVLQIDVTNHGPLDNSGVSLKMETPPGASYNRVVSGTGFDRASGVWNIGSLATASSRSLQVEYNVPAGAPTTITFQVTNITAAVSDGDPTDDSLSLVFIPVKRNTANLVTKLEYLGLDEPGGSDRDNPVDTGKTVRYRLSVENLGNADAFGGFTTAITYPSRFDGTTEITGDRAPSAITAGSPVTWNYDFDLIANSVATLEFRARANAAGVAAISVTAANNAAPDPNDFGDSLSHTLSIGSSVPNLETTITSNASATTLSNGTLSFQVNEANIVEFTVTIANKSNIAAYNLAGNLGPEVTIDFGGSIQLWQRSVDAASAQGGDCYDANESDVVTPVSDPDTFKCGDLANSSIHKATWKPSRPISAEGNSGDSVSLVFRAQLNADAAITVSSPVFRDINRQTLNDNTQAGDVLRANITVIPAAPAIPVVQGELKTEGTNGKLASVTAHLLGIPQGGNRVDVLHKWLGPLAPPIPCSLRRGGREYECNLAGYNSAENTGVALQWTSTKSSDKGCYNAAENIFGGVGVQMPDEDNYAYATHWKIRGISGTTTQDIALVNRTSNCAAALR